MKSDFKIDFNNIFLKLDWHFYYWNILNFLKDFNGSKNGVGIDELNQEMHILFDNIKFKYMN